MKRERENKVSVEAYQTHLRSSVQLVVDRLTTVTYFEWFGVVAYMNQTWIRLKFLTLKTLTSSPFSASLGECLTRFLYSCNWPSKFSKVVFILLLFHLGSISLLDNFLFL